MLVPDFDALAQGGIKRLRAYDPGHDIVALRRQFGASALLELGSNENPYGPSPRVRDAVLSCLPDLHRYPDPLGTDLKLALASRLRLAPGQIVLGNGSHELLMMLAQVFGGPKVDVIASEFGFAVYAIAAQAADAKFIKVPALPATAPMPRGHDLDAIAARVSTRTSLIYLANPNNPTGTWFGTSALDEFLARLRPNALVVVDEAYLEYVTDPALVSAVTLLSKYPNLIVTRTFSKAYGLAGLRVGYACAHPNLVQVLERVRESFNVNTPGLVACLAALGDEEHLQAIRCRNDDQREWLSGQLRRRGLEVPPSQTNFVLVDFGREAAPIEAALVQGGVVLRPMVGYGLPGCLRITVGTREENLRLLASIDEVLP